GPLRKPRADQHHAEHQHRARQPLGNGVLVLLLGLDLEGADLGHVLRVLSSEIGNGETEDAEDHQDRAGPHELAHAHISIAAGRAARRGPGAILLAADCVAILRKLWLLSRIRRPRGVLRAHATALSRAIAPAGPLLYGRAP